MPARPRKQTEMIKVTDGSIMTTAGIIGALAGLVAGSFWFSGAVFVVFAYLAREAQENELSKLVRGVARGTIEVLNYSAFLDDKFAVTSKVGDAFRNVANSAKKERASAPPTAAFIKKAAGTAKADGSSGCELGNTPVDSTKKAFEIDLRDAPS